MNFSNCHLNDSSYYNNDSLIGTIHYSRTGDYDPDMFWRGRSLKRAVHAIIIVGKSTESDEIYLVAPFSNHWPDRTHKVPVSEYVIGGTGELHAGVPYRILKDNIRIAYDGGRKVLKPGALEKLLAKIEENKSSDALLLERRWWPAQERIDGAQSQRDSHGGGSQRGHRFGGRANRHRQNSPHYRIVSYPQNH